MPEPPARGGTEVKSQTKPGQLSPRGNEHLFGELSGRWVMARNLALSPNNQGQINTFLEKDCPLT